MRQTFDRTAQIAKGTFVVGSPHHIAQTAFLADHALRKVIVTSEEPYSVGQTTIELVEASNVGSVRGALERVRPVLAVYIVEATDA